MLFGGVSSEFSGISAVSVGGPSLDCSIDTARERRPTGEGVKNFDSPSISPLVFLFTVSVAGVGVRGVREEEEESGSFTDAA